MVPLYIKVLFFALLCSLTFPFEVKVQADTSANGSDKSDHTNRDRLKNLQRHFNCIDDSFQPIIFRPQGYDHQRMLQTANNPHPFKIYGQFPASPPAGNTANLVVLEQMFKIGARYYYEVLKVTDLAAGQTVYPYSNNCFNSVVPAALKTTGFDQSQMDIYVFIELVHDSTVNFVAQAGPCVILRWPTYGMTRYNTFYVATDITRTGQFHNNIMTTIHEIGHILGVSNSMFQQVYVSYTSNTQLTNSSIFGTSSNGKTMIILPQTKAYVQSHFGCSNTSIGAAIEDEGSSGSVGSHWQRKVFYDDFMTASVWSSGAKITELSMAYFEDTGFYYSVDRTKAEPSFFGKNKGCDFAIGAGATSAPEYCQSGDPDACGFSRQYGGTCNSNDQFDSGAFFYRPYSNTICNMRQTVLDAAAGYTSVQQHYDWNGRCFTFQNSVSSTSSKCFKSSCTASGIEFYAFNAQNVTCARGATSVSTSYGTVLCPPDYDAFCGRQPCQNWCYGQGMCMKGTCILLPCTQAITSCSTCVLDIVHRCTSCANSMFPSQNRLSCVTCPNAITDALTCLVDTGFTVATSCGNSKYPASNRLSCVVCATAITECSTCALESDRTICQACINGKFPNAARSSCVTCPNAIANCNTCSLSSGRTICSACSGGMVPSASGDSCSITCTIANCLVCSSTGAGGTQVCSSCSNGNYLATDTLSCPSCSSITDCSSCVNNAGTVKCTSCQNSKFLSVDQLSCNTCGSIITQCTTCIQNANTTQCTTCSANFFVAANSLSCQACQTRISNCDSASCVVQNSVIKCNTCAGNYLPAADRLSCLACNALISDCATCHKNSTGTTICDSCSTLFLSQNQLSCQTCDQKIPDCTTCRDNSTHIVCDVCITNMFRSTDSLSCQTCATKITNCVQCTDNSGTINCATCISGFVAASNRLSCQTCGTAITNCLTCQNTGSNVECSSCASGFYVATNMLSCIPCSSSLTNCAQCNNNAGTVVCSNCMSGFHLDASSNCDLCSNIITNCNTCSFTTQTVCSACASGSILAANRLSCGDCSSAIPNCHATSCENSTGVYKCTTCTSGLLTSVDRLSCVSCVTRIPDCSSCVDNGSNNVTCSACSTLFLMNNKTGCASCGNAISGCSTCSVNSTHTLCDSCSSGIVFPTSDQLGCSPCDIQISNCLTCAYSKPVLTCVACFNNLFPTLTNNACNSCSSIVSNCAVCVYSSRTQCSVCLDGYFQTGGACSACDSSCLTCTTSAIQCTSCAQGFSVNAANQCTQTPPVVQSFGGTCDITGTTITCDYGCLVCTCTNANTKTCVTPMEGFVVNSGSAIKCGTGCLTCNSANPAQCTSCFQLYTLTVNTCTQCHSSCATCDPTNQNRCLTCPQAFEISASGLCVSCQIKNCKICQSSTVCSTCRDGYFFSSRGLCEECVSDCGGCAQTSINVCTSCRDMQYLDTTTRKCKDCPEGCLTCDATLSCTGCMQGYTIQVSSRSCKKQCKFPCLACSSNDENNCTSCLGGYTLNSSTGKGICRPVLACTGTCTFCPLGTRDLGTSCGNCTVSNCADCDININTCQACVPGFYLSSSTQCTTCPTQCKTCRSNNFCQTCSQGYTKVKQNSQKIDRVMRGACLACQSPCLTCEKSTTRCKSCVQGYKLLKYGCKIKDAVVFDVKLNININDFMNQAVFRKIREMFAAKYPWSEITFSLIESGSTVVQGQVGNPVQSSNMQLCTQNNEMKSFLGEGQTLEGVSILSSSLQTSDSQTCDSGSSPASSMIYIIIGLGVGVPLLVVVAILIGVCIKRNLDSSKEKVFSNTKMRNAEETKEDIHITDLE